MTKKVTRLCEQFTPENYNLILKIDSDELKFAGKVIIKGQRRSRPSKRITFHQKELKITEASIIQHTKKGDVEIDVGRINNQNSLDEVRLHADQLIVSGEYTITMKFKGKITKPMNGIYPCFFKHDGKDKKLIATQFESHHAREAFPCIDEPEAKATFDLSLINSVNQTVLSNTPVVEQITEDKKLKTTFETTPKMSSYLLAFVIGELDYKEFVTKDKVKVRCYATPSNKDSLDFSVDVAVKSLEFFEDYFGVQYPLKKLDMVALPDFSSGAMENWGLITYRESAMLIDKKSSSVESKQGVSLVIAHEMSHQWFGNLVTMKWWDDLWLNESFANMMEYRAIDAIFPEWNIFETFISHEGVAAKRRDTLKEVQPVHCAVNHPDEISTLFDPAIVYAKGGTLLYMLMNFIGEPNFKKGLTNYFNKHSYKNTVADDLWQSLSEASGKNISSMMENWLNKPGYPLIDVEWDPNSDIVGLNQRRFLNNKTSDESQTVWQVPLSSNRLLSDDKLDSQTKDFNLRDNNNSALILNNDGKSYLVAKYSNKKHQEKIITEIKENKISTINRFLLLDNLNLMQRLLQADSIDLLELLSAYTNEKSETVWEAISMALSEIRRLVEPESPHDKKINKLALGLIGDLVDKLGWLDRPEDDSQTLRLRGLSYSLAAASEDKKIIDDALNKFDKMKKPSDLSSSTRPVVYYCVSKFGDEDKFNKLLKLYSAEISAEEKEEVCAALCCVKNDERIDQLVDLLKSDTIRRQNLMSWFAGLLRNKHSRQTAWKWLITNWLWIEKEFSSDKSYGYFARIAGAVFSKKNELDMFVDFFEDKKDVIALKREIILATEEITNRVNWRNKNEPQVREWLDKY